MQLNLNFDGFTKLKDWWQIVKDNFSNIQTEVNNRVSTTDYATNETAGVIKVGDGLEVTDEGAIHVAAEGGIRINDINWLETDPATEADIQRQTDEHKPITPYYLDYAVRSVIDDIIIGEVTVDGQTIEDIMDTKLRAYYDTNEVDGALADKADKTTVNRYKQELDDDISDTNADLSALTQRVNTYLSPFGFGVYAGDGTTDRVIGLGYRPKAVLVVTSNGQMGGRPAGDSFRLYGGLALDGYAARNNNNKAEISANGFTVSGECNLSGTTYYYIAIKSDSEIVVH